MVSCLTMSSLAYSQVDLKGVWVQAAQPAGAVSGKSDSAHDNQTFTKSYTDNRDVQWRLEVIDQKGRAFHAKWCSADRCESVVGAFRSNGEILMADEDGVFMVTLENGLMDLCYAEPGVDFQIVGCQTLKRQ